MLSEEFQLADTMHEQVGILCHYTRDSVTKDERIPFSILGDLLYLIKGAVAYHANKYAQPPKNVERPPSINEEKTAPEMDE